MYQLQCFDLILINLFSPHQLMNAVTNFVDGDRKGLENNIRVCLSSNSCFVKVGISSSYYYYYYYYYQIFIRDIYPSNLQVPINPECPNAKRNFWKVDDSKITPKILRRHFRGLSDVFPNLYGNMEILSAKNVMENKATYKRPEAEKKFTSPFSIESLLQRESSISVRHRPVGLHDCATRNIENKFLGRANGDSGLACKRKTQDWPSQTAYVNFSGSYSHFCFPTYSLGQINNGCSPPSGPSKRLHSVSELSYCTAPESFRYFTLNALSWAYM